MGRKKASLAVPPPWCRAGGHAGRTPRTQAAGIPSRPHCGRSREWRSFGRRGRLLPADRCFCQSLQRWYCDTESSSALFPSSVCRRGWRWSSWEGRCWSGRTTSASCPGSPLVRWSWILPSPPHWAICCQTKAIRSAGRIVTAWAGWARRWRRGCWSCKSRPWTAALCARPGRRSALTRLGNIGRQVPVAWLGSASPSSCI